MNKPRIRELNVVTVQKCIQLKNIAFQSNCIISETTDYPNVQMKAILFKEKSMFTFTEIFLWCLLRTVFLNSMIRSNVSASKLTVRFYYLNSFFPFSFRCKSLQPITTNLLRIYISVNIFWKRKIPNWARLCIVSHLCKIWYHKEINNNFY